MAFYILFPEQLGSSMLKEVQRCYAQVHNKDSYSRFLLQAESVNRFFLKRGNIYV